MKTYKIVNNLTGWVIFAIAAFTYCSTIEPSASFWDCPEFITTAARLEVGHPPGAPFFMLVGNLFSQFAGSPAEVAKMVNIMSALLSAGCILFLFWSVTHLARKLICREGEDISAAKIIAIMGSGVAGALIYTWSDTFWFSAVEGEVYAFSSFFTALVFWLILKWEDNADKPGSDRWLVFIAYLVGLSIGVHLLNLLCIPAMALVFYYKKSKNATAKGSLWVLVVSMVIVAAVLYGIVPGIVKVGGWFELLFVNGLGMSFNSGLYVYLVLLVVSLVWALRESTTAKSKVRMNVSFLVSLALLGIPFYGHGVACVLIGIVVLAVVAFLLFTQKRITPRLLNTSLLCMTLIAVGYSSYAVIVIRSTANPPMDQDSPEDMFSLGEYLGREQYGDKPLLFGQTYASVPNIVESPNGDLIYETSKGAKVYQRKEKESADEKDRYEVVHEKIEYVYPFDQQMVFPRVFSDTERHVRAYQQWLGGVKGKTVKYNVPGHGTQETTIPTQLDNIKFFFSYQVNFMYWRYFMWNFAGRQNDMQGNGELEHGNWLSGIPFLDNMRLGDQSKLPSELLENKGRNVFYCLPLLLGLIGFFWQAFRDKKSIQQFWVVFFLFFMTGLAIILYLNQTPMEPRERDYAYAGSFYAFAMWCGLGIAAIYEGLQRVFGKKLDKRKAALASSLVALVPAVAVPLQMVSQTWDDHDRSGRYICRDFGLNYLETVPQNGVIFTCGDNDTFPLWYNEDTEGNRTDVRVCNLSYLQTPWYIDQMKRPAYTGKGESSPLPISWNRLQYTAGKNEMIPVNPTVSLTAVGEVKVKNLVKRIYEEDSVTARAIWGDNPFELKNAIRKFVLKEDIDPRYAELVKELPACLPSDTLYITVDKEAVRRSGMKIFNDSIPDVMTISLEGQGRVSKSFMMMLEVLAQTNFSRPVYMSTTVGPDNYGNLLKHFVQEGMAWRFTPYTFESNRYLSTVVDTEKMYDNMMNHYHYGNLKQKGLYIDETTMRMCYTHRRWFAVLINNLVAEGKKDKALKALEKCVTEIPAYNIPHDAGSGSLELANAYIACGKAEKAADILAQLEKKAVEYVNWYLSLSPNRFIPATDDCERQLTVLGSMRGMYEQMCVSCSAADKVRYEKKIKALEDKYEGLVMSYYSKCELSGMSFH